MTETEKMLAGKIYDGQAPELKNRRIKAHRLNKEFNMTDETEEEKRGQIIKELFSKSPELPWVEGPIYIDYGEFTTFGRNCYANFNFTVLDTCPVTIGNNVFFGPNCSILTALHPLIASERAMFQRDDGVVTDDEYGAPVTIGSDCWIASDVKILPGVTIGDGCVIGAGSVVTKDVPAGSLAAGNPCRVIRKITEEDSIKLKKELW